MNGNPAPDATGGVMTVATRAPSVAHSGWFRLVQFLAKKQTDEIEQVDLAERVEFWIDRPRTVDYPRT